MTTPPPPQKGNFRMQCKHDTVQSMERITVVVCDHQARDLLSCVNRAIILSNGKIIASGSPDEVISDKDAKTQYFGEGFNIK